MARKNLNLSVSMSSGSYQSPDFEPRPGDYDSCYAIITYIDDVITEAHKVELTYNKININGEVEFSVVEEYDISAQEEEYLMPSSLFMDKGYVSINIKLIAGSEIAIEGYPFGFDLGDGIFVSTITPPTMGEVNAGENIGTGTGIYSGKSASNLQFKTLKEGTNITITETADEITINSTGGGGTVDPSADVDWTGQHTFTLTPTVNGNDVATVDITDALDTRITTNEGDISTLQGTVSSNTGRISTVETEQGVQNSRLNALETSSNALDGRVGILETASATHSTQISDLETADVYIQQDITTLENRNINTGNGIKGGGNLTADRTLSIDVNGLPEETMPATNSYVIAEDISGNTKKVKLENLLTANSSRFSVELTPNGNGGTTTDPEFPTINSSTIPTDERVYLVTNETTITNSITGQQETYRTGEVIRAIDGMWIHESTGIHTVFGRDDQNVVAETGDYNSDQITNVSTVSGVSVSDAIEALDADITAVEGRVSQNESDITTNEGNISTNTTNISTNQTNIFNNSSRITNVEGTVAGLVTNHVVPDGGNTGDILVKASATSGDSTWVDKVKNSALLDGYSHTDFRKEGVDISSSEIYYKDGDSVFQALQKQENIDAGIREDVDSLLTNEDNRFIKDVVTETINPNSSLRKFDPIKTKSNGVVELKAITAGRGLNVSSMTDSSGFHGTGFVVTTLDEGGIGFGTNETFDTEELKLDFEDVERLFTYPDDGTHEIVVMVDNKPKLIPLNPQFHDVTTVFGRKGSIQPVAGDYDSGQITNNSAVDGGFVTQALNNLKTAIDLLTDEDLITRTVNLEEHVVLLDGRVDTQTAELSAVSGRVTDVEAAVENLEMTGGGLYYNIPSDVNNTKNNTLTVGNNYTTFGADSMIFTNYPSQSGTVLPNSSTHFGSEAGIGNDNHSNTFFGAKAGTNSSMTSSIAIGYSVGSGSSSSSSIYLGGASGNGTSGSNNIGIGYQSSFGSSGSQTIAIGDEAAKNSTATEIIAIGKTAGENATGSNVVAIGSNTGIGAGSRSVNIGAGAGGALNTTSDVVAIGHEAAGQDILTPKYENLTDIISIGSGSLKRQSGNISLENIIAIGKDAGRESEGTGNIFIGNNNSNFTSTIEPGADSVNNIVIGHDINADGSNKIIIGNDSQEAYIGSKKILLEGQEGQTTSVKVSYDNTSSGMEAVNLQEAVDELNSDTEAVKLDILTNSSNIDDNTASISTNTANISTNADGIANNTINISTNVDNIVTKASLYDTNTFTGWNNFSSTGSIKIPVGDTSQRVETAGSIRLNSETGQFEGFNGTEWVDFKKGGDLPPASGSWNKISMPINRVGIYSYDNTNRLGITISPVNGDYYYFDHFDVGDNFLYKSTDKGVTWNKETTFGYSTVSVNDTNFSMLSSAWNKTFNRPVLKKGGLNGSIYYPTTTSYSTLSTFNAYLDYKVKIIDFKNNVYQFNTTSEHNYYYYDDISSTGVVGSAKTKTISSPVDFYFIDALNVDDEKLLISSNGGLYDVEEGNYTLLSSANNGYYYIPQQLYYDKKNNIVFYTYMNTSNECVIKKSTDKGITWETLSSGFDFNYRFSFMCSDDNHLYLFKTISESFGSSTNVKDKTYVTTGNILKVDILTGNYEEIFDKDFSSLVAILPDHVGQKIIAQDINGAFYSKDMY